MKSMKRHNTSRIVTAEHLLAKKPNTLASFCNSGRRVKAAFVTPYPPRHDGLAQHAANLRSAIVEQCPSLQVGLCTACS